VSSESESRIDDDTVRLLRKSVEYSEHFGKEDGMMEERGHVLEMCTLR
jgi:hypothetical protein